MACALAEANVSAAEMLIRPTMYSRSFRMARSVLPSASSSALSSTSSKRLRATSPRLDTYMSFDTPRVLP